MMFIVKNLQENKSGNVECEILSGETWGEFVMSPNDEYEIHESSEWKGIKPCPQAEKNAYAIEQANAAILAELATLDATPRLLEEAALGDEYAINKLMELKERKDALRASLK